jgi:hypothetical protein
LCCFGRISVDFRGKEENIRKKSPCKKPANLSPNLISLNPFARLFVRQPEVEGLSIFFRKMPWVQVEGPTRQEG